MRIAIMGAGGLGSYIGARLAEAGAEVVFVGRGRRLAALKSGGLLLRSPVGDLDLVEVQATDDPAEVGPVNLVLFTVKLWDTEQAAAKLAPMLGEQTRVVTLQNGIDSRNMIARYVPGRRVIGGVTYISANVAEPGFVRSPGGQQRLIVESAGGDPVIAAFAETCGRAKGIRLELTDAIDVAIWEKFTVNATFSASTSLMRSSIGPIMTNPESRLFVRQLLDEGHAVAKAVGVPINPALPDLAIAGLDALPPGMKASMAEDVLRGRKLEISWMSGRIHGLGQEHGVPTPAHTAAYRCLLLHANGAAATSEAIGAMSDDISVEGERQ